MHGAAAVNVGTSSDINIVHTARDSISACTWDQEMPKTAANGFPSKVFDVQDPSPPGKVILAWCGCEDPLSYMYEVVKKVFDRLLSTNVIIKVEELCVEIKPHRKYVYEYEQGPQPEHSLYLVKTPDGNQYAVDLSGAQYGILDRPVIPWREYNDSYVEKVMNIRGQGYLLGRSGSSVTERVNQARDMDDAIKDWCEQTTLELGDLLTMATGAEFDSAREEVCQLVRKGVENGSRKRMAEEETNAQ
ncbi:hypothetical protein CB0940_04717 [Cercospora beticola]|uniref:Uncharacterized protein n=2 Tax=Cercospora beticola TaxID=122368 RepID=A0A2G5HLH2_CERBT|nr:hypothetical protein CB0940_04717 [Cercospora beticola]PIA93365.1 hypothetical protein CB0940_04717 [Cercospora beticola]